MFGIANLWSGSNKELVWSKTMTQNTYGSIRQSKFNGDGRIVIFLLNSPIVLIVRAIDGGLINSQKFSSLTGCSASPGIRQLAASSANIPVIYASYYQVSACTGYVIVSFLTAIDPTTTIWAMKSVSKSTLLAAVKLAESDSILYVLENQSLRLVVSRLNAGTGAV